MTNTAKHFVCYSLLVICLLFVFMLFKKAQLDGAVTAQQLADKQNAFLKVKAKDATEMAERDKQLTQVNDRLDKEQRNAQTLDQQIELINQLLKLPKPLTVQASTPPAGLVTTAIDYKAHPFVGDGGVEPGIEVPKEDVAYLAAKSVECTKCENSMLVATKDLATQEELVAQQDNLLQDYKKEVAQQPHTRWQRFHIGVKWVFSLGSSKQ